MLIWAKILDMLQREDEVGASMVLLVVMLGASMASF